MLSFALVAILASAPVCAEEEAAPAIRAVSDALHDARGEWRETARLPWNGDWLDVKAVLGGLVQQDNLRDTKHDDEKCGAMVATAAALTGGPERFRKLLDRIEAKARGRDRANVIAARRALDARTLTAGDLHRVSEALYRTYVGGRDGSSDGDISKMIRASGRPRVATAAKSPREILAELAPGEAFPLNVYLEQPEFIGWHVVLVWKDADGTPYVYDSDRMPGSQVFGPDRPEFRSAYLDYVSPGEKVAAEWLPGTKFGR